MIFIEMIFSYAHIMDQSWFVCGVPAPVVENTSFSHWVAFVPLSKITCLNMWESISELSVLFCWSLFIFTPIAHCLGYCSFIISLEISASPSTFFFFKVVFLPTQVSCFPMGILYLLSCINQLWFWLANQGYKINVIRIWCLHNRVFQVISMVELPIYLGH